MGLSDHEVSSDMLSMMTRLNKNGQDTFTDCRDSIALTKYTANESCRIKFLAEILGRNFDKTKILKTSGPFTPSPDVLHERIDLCAAPKVESA